MEIFSPESSLLMPFLLHDTPAAYFLPILTVSPYVHRATSQAAPLFLIQDCS